MTETEFALNLKFRIRSPSLNSVSAPQFIDFAHGTHGTPFADLSNDEAVTRRMRRPNRFFEWP